MGKENLDGRPLVNQMKECIPPFEWKGDLWEVESASWYMAHPDVPALTVEFRKAERHDAKCTEESPICAEPVERKQR